MLQRRLCEEDEEGEKPGEKKKKKKKGRGRVGDLRIHDLEEELEMSNDSDCSVGDGKYRWSLTSPSPPRLCGSELRRHDDAFLKK